MFRSICMLSVYAHDFFQHYMPCSRLLAATRTRCGLGWGVPVRLVGVPYFAIVNVCSILVDRGAPQWLRLVVLWGIWNAFEFILNGPVSLFRLVRLVMCEQMVAKAVRPTGRGRVTTKSGC